MSCHIVIPRLLLKNVLETISHIKAALINIFILIMHQMTVCNVKGVPLPTAVPLRSTDLFSRFQLVILVSWPTTLLFGSLLPVK